MPSYFQSIPYPEPARAKHGATWVGRYDGPYKYQIGQTDFKRDTVTILAGTKQGDAVFVSDKVNLPNGPHWACGWESSDDVEPVPGGKPATDRSPCMAQLARLSYRSSIGEQFNKPNHSSNDGSYTYPVAQQCTGAEWRNNAAEDAVSAGVSITVARQMSHPLYDFEGFVSTAPAKIHARYVTIDRHALVIRSDEAGWGNLSTASCYTGPPQGGPPNTDG